jgi:hypothetical protein
VRPYCYPFDVNCGKLPKQGNAAESKWSDPRLKVAAATITPYLALIATIGDSRFTCFIGAPVFVRLFAHSLIFFFPVREGTCGGVHRHNRRAHNILRHLAATEVY